MLRAAWLLPLVALACGRTEPYRDAALCAKVPKACVSADNPCAGSGSLSGQVCAPDGRTWVNGAKVTLRATDCEGKARGFETYSGADGAFSLDDVPAGTWQLQAELGAFTQQTQVTVRADANTQVGARDLCLLQRDVKLAVVTGAGDKIEHVLDALGLRYTVVGGTKGSWPTEGAPFLTDLARMKQFDFIVVDCAAASPGGFVVDFGGQADAIARNLRDYVLAGGSLYASDWALLFALSAAPGRFDFKTSTGVPPASPLDTTTLLGFAPQTVNAAVQDEALRTFLGKDSVSIRFPKQSGAVSSHWGLLAAVPGATVLARADGVQTCSDAACTTPGPTIDGVPLLARAKLTPESARGGFVVYSAFHNVAQSSGDVAQLLKYLMLSL